MKPPKPTPTTTAPAKPKARVAAKPKAKGPTSYAVTSGFLRAQAAVFHEWLANKRWNPTRDDIANAANLLRQAAKALDSATAKKASAP